MKRPKINDYPKKIDGKCQYYHDDLEKYMDYLEEKIINLLLQIKENANK